MLDKVLDLFSTLNLRKNNLLVIDCTLGQGGHSYELFQNINSGTLVSIDIDNKSIEWVKSYYGINGDGIELENKKWIIINDNFKNLNNIIKQFNSVFDFLIADLGISNYQIKRNLGISYSRGNQILDMRLDKSVKPAYEILNTISKDQLKDVFIELGQVNENLAAKISNEIVKKRYLIKFTKVDDLNKILNKYGKGIKVKIFQALRTFINDEINNLKSLLDFIKHYQDKNGLSIIITFNELEEKIVNDFLGDHEIIEPNIFELIENVQARTAKLHIYKI